MIKSRANNYVGFLFFPVHSTLGISKKLFISFVSTLQEGTQRLKLTLRMLIYFIQLWNRQIKQNIIDLILFGHYGNPLGADGTQVGVQPDMPRWLLDVPEIEGTIKVASNILILMFKWYCIADKWIFDVSTCSSSFLFVLFIFASNTVLMLLFLILGSNLPRTGGKVRWICSTTWLHLTVSGS